MKTNPFVHSYQIKGVPYLLPHGQAVADYIKGTSTNELGLRIWELLETDISSEAMLSQLAQEYEVTEEEFPEFKKDVVDYLSSLKNHGFLSEGAEYCCPFPSFSFQAGPLVVSCQIPETLFQTCFTDFACSKELTPSLQIRLFPYESRQNRGGNVLLRNDEMLIIDHENCYVLVPLRSEYVFEIHISKDGKNADIFGKCYTSEPACLEALFQAIRFPFLVAAQGNGLCLLHSASLLFQEKAWLFSGHSGVGKSTHTSLWHVLFDTPYLNGDLNMIGMENGQPYCYGLPWCGTSGICTTQKYPLGGVVFLKQAPYNKVTMLSPDQEVLFLTQRLISPSWTQEQMSGNLLLAEEITSHIRIFRLECTKDPEAARLMQETILNA